MLHLYAGNHLSDADIKPIIAILIMDQTLHIITMMLKLKVTRITINAMILLQQITQPLLHKLQTTMLAVMQHKTRAAVIIIQMTVL